MPSVEERRVLKNASNCNSEHFVQKPTVSQHCQTGFPRSVVPRHCLGFSSYRSTGKCKKSQRAWSSELYLGFLSTKKNWSAHTKRSMMKKLKVTKRRCVRVIAFLAVLQLAGTQNDAEYR